MLVVLVVGEIRKFIARLIVLRTKQCSNCFHFSVTWLFFFNLRPPALETNALPLELLWLVNKGELIKSATYSRALWSLAGKGLTTWLSFAMLNCVFVYFSMWYPGSGVVLDCIDLWSLPLLLHCTKQYALSSILFMILLENIVVQQRSNFIQFIHISFKDPQFISSDH